MNALGALAEQHILLDKLLKTECAALPEYRKKARDCMANAERLSIDAMVDEYVRLMQSC